MIEPSPELIDVLWGMYLATGSYQPIGRIVKLLPLTNDRGNVDNLTTGNAAKFTLASNAVRDLHLLAMLKRAVKGQPEDVAKVLNDAIETAENVDTVRMRKESLAAIKELKQKGPNLKRELSGLGQIGQGALSMGCVCSGSDRTDRVGHPLRDRRRRLFSWAATYFEVKFGTLFARPRDQPSLAGYSRSAKRKG